MLVIPAIDIRCGKFIHSISLPRHTELAGVDDPVKIAEWWEEKGAKMLQITDLDGCFTGHPENIATIKEIIANVRIPVQVAGGIRTLDHIKELLDLGAFRVLISTNAVRKPDLIRQACKDFGEAMAVSIEGKNGMVAIEGWNQPTDWTIKEMSEYLKDLGVKRVVFSDTRRYGSLKGPNLEAAQIITDEVGLKAIIAGGISSEKDLENLKNLNSLGIEGAIVGKALYSGLISLKVV